MYSPRSRRDDHLDEFSLLFKKDKLKNDLHVRESVRSLFILFYSRHHHGGEMNA